MAAISAGSLQNNLFEAQFAGPRNHPLQDVFPNPSREPGDKIHLPQLAGCWVTE